LLVMDVQEKLFNAMPVTRSDMIKNCQKLIKAAQILKMPILVTEQYPKGLGPTIEDIRKDLPPDVNIAEKTEFSCVDNSKMNNRTINGAVSFSHSALYSSL